jgi:Ca-activated chloride channel homolog
MGAMNEITNKEDLAMRNPWKTVAKSLALCTAFALTLGLLGAAPALASGPAELKVAVSQPVLEAGKRQVAYLKVALVGTPLVVATARAPINLAIVIDRSGSMSGAKLENAKDAAIQAVYKLGPQDIVSVVAYDHNVDVLLPATRATDKAEIARAIQRLYPGGSTALYGAVSRGSQEVRKFIAENQVNRVLLLSDGMANVGPSSPEALGALGAALGKEGISVTTLGLGLGYNEDLMVQLARMSDGNHAFIEHPSQLAQIFQYEFGDLMSVVATDVEVQIACPRGVRPLRVLGRDAEVAGQIISTRLSQLYGKQEKYILVEVEVDPQEAGARLELAQVAAAFTSAESRARVSLSSQAAVAFSASAEEARRSVDRDVTVAAVEMIANENNKRALALRDQGQVDQARSALLDNERYLNDNAARFGSDRLSKQGKMNRAASENLDEANWNKNRKGLRKMQYELDSQQSY